jgi:hypothetical protein
MSQLLSFANRGVYSPWQRPPLRSDARVRSQSRPLPAYVSTCWELNFLIDENHPQPSHPIPRCGGCALFEGDKHLYAHLRRLDSNKEAPYRYRCLTPWVEAAGASLCTKRKAVDPPAILSPTGDATPNKKRKASPRLPHNVTRVAVSSPALSSSAHLPTPALPIRVRPKKPQRKPRLSPRG